MITWLQKHGNYTSNGKDVLNYLLGLTFDERRELEQLRVDIKKYREMDGEDDSASEKSKSVRKCWINV
jgi:hypothetical protein